MRASPCKSLRLNWSSNFLAGFLLFAWLPIAPSSIVAQANRQAAASSVTQTRSAVSKVEFDIIEGRFHDGLGTFAELNLANELIKAAHLSQPLFDASRAESKMREAIASLPETHASRAIFQQEIINITAATQAGANALLNRTKPAVLLRVRHTPREYADAKAGDLRLQFADRDDLPVSVKTDKSNKVAVAEGQTPHLYAKWAARYFRVSEQEWQQMIADLGFASPMEWKRHYLNAARLVAEVLIRKLKLEDCAPDDFRKARVTDLEAVKYLLRQLKVYKSGNDRSSVIIFDRSMGAVKWESLLDEIDIESLTVNRVSFLPSRPRNQHPTATEFGVKIDNRTVVSFQIKHKRGRARLSAQHFEFSDITTRLRINR